MPKKIPEYQGFYPDRLLEVCPDLQQLVLDWPYEECVTAPVIMQYVEEDFRHTNYDLGRVHFFIREFAAGRRVEPVVMDSNRGWTPIICDGRHRLVAAVHTSISRVNVSFSGLVSVANYCTGKRKTNPLC